MVLHSGMCSNLVNILGREINNVVIVTLDDALKEFGLNPSSLSEVEEYLEKLSEITIKKVGSNCFSDRLGILGRLKSIFEGYVGNTEDRLYQRIANEANTLWRADLVLVTYSKLLRYPIGSEIKTPNHHTMVAQFYQNLEP